MACTENGTLWTAVNERNEPGSDLLLGQHIDTRGGQTLWPKHSGGAVFGRQALRRADRRLDRICQ